MSQSTQMKTANIGDVVACSVDHYNNLLEYFGCTPKRLPQLIFADAVDPIPKEFEGLDLNIHVITGTVAGNGTIEYMINGSPELYRMFDFEVVSGCTPKTLDLACAYVELFHEPDYYQDEDETDDGDSEEPEEDEDEE